MKRLLLLLQNVHSLPQQEYALSAVEDLFDEQPCDAVVDSAESGACVGSSSRVSRVESLTDGPSSLALCLRCRSQENAKIAEN